MIAKLTLILMLAICTGIPVTASTPVFEKLVKYDFSPENSLALPTDFAGHFIVDQTALSKLGTKKIHHIELVYTTYRTSPTFDQDALNNRRVSALKSLLPQVVSDKPTWSYVAQTGAQTAEEAKAYFHGFVIHYSDDLDYHNLSTFLEEFQKPFSTYEVNNATGGRFLYESGSGINIAPLAVTHTNGTPVSGSYQLSYREFRNPAEIALSGIPMTYTENGQEYNFSSVGMYEIRATQNGKELKLQKSITVDFNCTAVKEDVSFYSMNQKGKWSELQKIQFDNQQQQINGDEMPAQRDNAVQKENHVKLAFNQNVEEMELRKIVTTHYKDYWLAELTKPLWDNYIQVKNEQPELFNDIVLEELPKKKQVKILPETSEKFNDIILFPANYVDGIEVRDDFVGIIGPIRGDGKALPNDKRSTLLAENADAGHTYPSLVKGLNSDNFGVYNCDQIYRIGTPVALAPTYLDSETGAEITNKQVACVIDLSYNGSFSFHPNQLMCNADGRNVILLFTSDKKIFMLDEQGFASLDKSTPRVKMPVKEVTAQLKSTEDLKKLLNI